MKRAIGGAVLHPNGTSTFYGSYADALAHVKPGDGAVEILEGDSL